MPGGPKVDVERVKQLLAAGLTIQQIVARLGCNKSTVARIARDRYERSKR